MYLLVIKQLAVMTLIVLAGFVFARLAGTGEREQQFLSRLLLYFINPCLVLSSFNLDFDALKLRQLAFVAVVSLCVHLIMIVTGLFATPGRSGSDLKALERVATVFTNCGFIGIPLIRGVFGESGVFFLMGYLVVFNVFLWTYGYYQLCGSINLRKIVTNPNIIAVCLGVILFCMPFRLPEFIGAPIRMIGDLNTAVAMILLGILFSSFRPDKKYLLRLIKFNFVRLVLCSVVNMLFLLLVSRLFHGMADLRLMLFVVLICSMCPAATSVPGLSVVFKKDTSYASLLVSVSSLLCLVTVPSFVALAELVIK